jgi:hypothetical protein
MVNFIHSQTTAFQLVHATASPHTKGSDPPLLQINNTMGKVQTGGVSRSGAPKRLLAS